MHRPTPATRSRTQIAAAAAAAVGREVGCHQQSRQHATNHQNACPPSAPVSSSLHNVKHGNIHPKEKARKLEPLRQQQVPTSHRQRCHQPRQQR